MSEAGGRQIAHMVFFQLKDRSDAARQALVDSCREHLEGHDGVVYLSYGERGEDFTRPVNDHAYDVGLHVVFESRSAHDAYQESPRHQAFVAANKESWESIRVFDSYVG